MTRQFMEVSIGIFLLTLSVTFVAAAFKMNASMERQYAQQQEVLAAAQEARKAFEEFGYLFAARTLEAQGALSPTDANAIATESLKSLEEQSERMGMLAKALNDAYLRQARNASR